jgi:hypothetical protein
MDEQDPTPERSTNRERRWAVVRIILGQAQMAAAVVGLVLLLSVGASWPTLVAVTVAGLLVIVSRLLFQDHDTSGGAG